MIQDLNSFPCNVVVCNYTNNYYLSSMTLTLVACMSVQHRRQCWGDRRYQISNYPGHVSRQFCLELREGFIRWMLLQFFPAMFVFSFSSTQKPLKMQYSNTLIRFTLYVFLPRATVSFLWHQLLQLQHQLSFVHVQTRPTYSRQTSTSSPSPGWTHTIKLWYRSGYVLHLPFTCVIAILNTCFILITFITVHTYQ